jgi:response regulator RpfG family c-di-GMP phosphodiesterase
VPLHLAVGHAGPECSGDLVTLRELATRARTAASLEDASTVLAAAELVGTMATDSELEVTLRLAQMASQADAGRDAGKVAAIAYEIANRMGFEGPERMQVRFVAHVANLGLAKLAVDEDDPAWQNHPIEAAAYLMATAGPMVAYAVRHAHEHWDGSGFPEGLSGFDIPAAARITAVAQTVLASGFDVEALAAGSGTRFEPAVVEAATELIREGTLKP